MDKKVYISQEKLETELSRWIIGHNVVAKRFVQDVIEDLIQNQLITNNLDKKEKIYSELRIAIEKAHIYIQNKGYILTKHDNYQRQ